MNNLQKYTIKDTAGYVTNIDAPDLPETVLTECRGGVSRQDGSIFQRDSGTLHRVPTPPIKPNAHSLITDISDSTGAVFTTAAAHGLNADDTIYIADTTIDGGRFNGKWTVLSAPTTTTFRIVDAPTVVTSGATTGTVGETPISILKVHTFVDTNGTEYEIVVGLDSNNLMRIYVYDSVWVELTRKLDGAYVAASSTHTSAGSTIRVGTVAENSVAYTPASDEFNNFVVVNTSQSNQTAFIVDTAAVSAAAVDLTLDVDVSVLGWNDADVLEIYRFPAMKFNYTYSNGTTPLINFLPVEEQRKVNMLYTESSTIRVARQSIQIMKRDARNYFYDGTSAYLRTLPAGWYVESDFGVINPFYGNHGTVSSPINTTPPTISQLSILSATNASPIEITTSVAHGLSTSDIVLISDVDTNTGANGIWVITVTSTTTFTLAGSAGNVGVGTSGYAFNKFTKTSIYDQTSGRNWMNCFTGIVTYAGEKKNLRFYMTALLGYQESDPIFQGFYYNSSYCGAYHATAINFALMNKEVSELILYGADAPDDGISTSTEWVDADSDYYKYRYRIMVQSNDTTNDQFYWMVRANNGYGTPYSRKSPFTVRSTQTQDAIASGQTTIADSLNHAVDKNRSYPKPRYAVRVARPQGAVTVIDADDKTLRISNRNGDNVNEDDNFPDVSVDNTAQVLKIYLNTSGELLGLGVLNDQVQAFKKTEREFKNLQSNFQGIVKCDFVARESLVLCPKGLAWAGEKGIYLLPSYGGEEEVLNPQWQNLYDGTLLATSTLPYFTSSYRAAIVGGYSETYESLWFSAQITTAAAGTEYISFVYSFQKKALSGKPVGWYQRKLNIGTTTGLVKCFSSRRSDKTLTIVTSNGILQYPNRSGSYLYQDDVLINGAGTQYSQSKGIPTKIKVNIGSLYGLSNRTVYDNFRIDFDGASISGAGTFNIKFWANKKTDAAVETKTQAIDSATVYPVVRPIPAFGSLERLAIQIDITENAESDHKKFDISTIEFGYAQNPQIGNK